MRRRLQGITAVILAVYLAVPGGLTVFGQVQTGKTEPIVRMEEAEKTEPSVRTEEAGKTEPFVRMEEAGKTEPIVRTGGRGKTGSFVRTGEAGKPETAAGIEEPGEKDSKKEPGDAEEKETAEKETEDGSGKPEEEVHLGIDNRHIFEGMENSYADGYVPVEEGDNVKIVIPFTADGELKDNTLTVALDFAGDKEAPFQIKNYQKDINPQTVTFDGETTEVYLYTEDILLQETRVKGQYPVKAKAEGFDKNGEPVSLEYVVFVNVTGNGEIPGNEEESAEGPSQETGMEPEGDSGVGQSSEASEEAVMHQPKFILEQCSLDGSILDAGSSQTAELVFRNKSKEFTACNVKVTITEEGEGNNLVFGRTSDYYETVRPGGTVVWKEELQIQDNAKEGNVPVKFTFEYENEKGTAYTGTETYTLRIRQPARVSLANYRVPAKVYSTDTISSDLQILNLGKSTVYNVRVSSQGRGIFAVQTFYAGTLEAGQSLQGNLSLYAGARNMESIHEEMSGTDREKYGKTEGTLVLEYEDIYGQTYSQGVAYETEIQAPKVLSLKADKKEETNQWWVSVLVLLGAGLIGGFFVQSMRIRNLKKRCG
ncbi:hypothetical protein [Blautia marasmi]|uniref:hypothetical protein n=1 Tax=Blautia marasmi TaxID=1917868 RepID=UPI00266C1795|nr:hypothetical protein [Blautia marasmi]